jgi:hypothetical protein
MPAVASGVDNGLDHLDQGPHSNGTQELGFTSSHEWVHVDGDLATVGISQFAVNQLNDLVNIELPPAGGVRRGSRRPRGLLACQAEFPRLSITRSPRRDR